MKRIWTIITVTGVCVTFSVTALGRSADNFRKEPASSALTPAYCNVAHNVGRIALGVNNDGTFGISFSVSWNPYDCFTGELLPSCEYPLGSRTTYLFGGTLWIGAVVGSDTLVSTGADGWSVSGNEFHPDDPPAGNMIYRSTTDHDASFYVGAVSEQDYIARYADTCLNCSGVSHDPMDGRAHRPLHIEVTQSTYAWSYPQFDDFVLMDYSIRNIGSQPLHDVYIGYYVDADIHDLAASSGWQDDLCGFREWQPALYLPPSCPPDSDRVNLAWAADNDGDLGQTYIQPVPHVTAMRIVRTPSDSLKVSFNWWISNANASLDYGPMSRSKVRDFGTGGNGTPEGDRNKYFLLSNGEFDFDQARSASIGSADSVWMPPPEDRATVWSTGLDTRYLLSFGPFDIEPGAALPVSLAYVAGADFHKNAENLNNLPNDPDSWYGGLNFDSLGANSVWANWIYDNPGIDTDSDGYSGEFKVCGEDTVWINGDGIPDFRATTPPLVPVLSVEPRDSALYVRWNGFMAETSVDVFSRERRFEGYHAYLSSTAASGSFARVGSYDREDYFRYYWDFEFGSWILTGPPMGVEDAICRYAPSGCDDASWHPLDYARQAPYVMPGHPDSLFYFEPCLVNACIFGLETPFEKRFPSAPKPEYASPQDVPLDSVDFYLTEEGYFKYYEYEFLIKNLLPGQPYWVSVTSFDYGSMVPGAEPAESGITGNAVMAVPLGGCCVGRLGDANGIGEYPGEVTLGDIMLMVDAKFITADCSKLPCLTEADINQSGGAVTTCDDITLLDIMILIDYVFINPETATLPNCL